MSDAREFFICDETDNSGYSVREWSEKEAKRQYGSCNVFHVIEYSAYEKIKAENENLRAAARGLVKAIAFPWVGQYGQIVNRHNREALEKYREAVGE